MTRITIAIACAHQLGDHGFAAMVLQVATLMPVRTIMNYQVRDAIFGWHF